MKEEIVDANKEDQKYAEPFVLQQTKKQYNNEYKRPPIDCKKFLQGRLSVGGSPREKERGRGRRKGNKKEGESQ